MEAATVKARRPSERLREWIENEIRGRQPGHRLPPDRELARTFGLAPRTVRKISAELREQGKLVRIPGRGTFVAGTDKPIPAEPPVKRASWELLADALIASMARGDLKRGDCLPAQKWLCHRFHVSAAAVDATPAPVDSELIIRGEQNLFCITE